MRRHLRRSRRKFFSPLAWKVRLVFWLGAVIVGLVCAGFAVMAEHANSGFAQLAQRHPYAPFIITPFGLLTIAWMTRRWFPGAQGSGIPQAIAALEISEKSTVVSLRIAAGKILLTLLGLLSGASIGREGPSVHVGAAIMHSLGALARFPAHYMERGLILAGGAAGIAAAFNTPLAGIVFAIEEMSRSFENRTSGIVTIAVVIAGVTALAVHGQYFYFGASHAYLPDATAWLAIVVCGIVGGTLGGLFSLALIHSTRRLAPFARRRPLVTAFVAGLAVAAIGFLSGYQANGTGYAEAKAIIDASDDAPGPWFALAKMGTTLASYLSGIPGGIFAPSLATGAGVGATLGELVPVAPMAVMVLLGMLAYFAGVVQAPLTAFIIMLEMTADQEMMLALMATAFIGYGSSHLVCPRPLYRTLAEAFLPSRHAGHEG